LGKSIASGLAYRWEKVSTTAYSETGRGSSYSPHIVLAKNLFILGTLTSLVANHTYSINPFPYLSLDIVATLAMYVHHQYIAAIIVFGSLAHLGIFLIRDFTSGNGTTGLDSAISRSLVHKNAIISHLSWVSLFLGFHTLLVFVHNDTVVSFAEADKQILIDPIFSQIILDSSADSSSPLQPRIPIMSGDVCAHHSIAVGLHISILILAKGFDSTGSSNLLADKASLGYAFPCDGPGRGGTCDSSSWDS
jgi:photosystem I P700 chlorophyll a apoprotein A2